MFSFHLSQLNWIRGVSKMQCAATALLSIFITETYLSENMRHKTVINYYFFLLCTNHFALKCVAGMHWTHGKRGASLHFAGTMSTLILPLCHFVTPLLSRQASAVQHKGRGSQVRRQLPKGAQFSVFCCKICLAVSVYGSTACLSFPEVAWFGAFRPSQVQFEDKGRVGHESQAPGNASGAAVGCSMCSHEFYSWNALGLMCPCCTVLAVHNSHCKWGPGHRVLPWVVWL